MNFPASFRYSLLLTGLLLATPFTQAATAPDSSTNTTAPAASGEVKPFNLEISHGKIIEDGKPTVPATVGNIFEYVKKKNAAFNLALAPGVANVEVSDMILHFAPGSAVPKRYDEDYTRPSYEANILCAAIIACTEVPLKTENLGDGLALKYAERDFKVAIFNLTDYVNPNADADAKTIETKLNAVQNVILRAIGDLNQRLATGKDVNFQFHEGANLLIVTGTDQAIDIATKVVDALTPKPSPDALARQLASNSAASWATSDIKKAPETPQTNLTTRQLLAMVGVLNRAKAQGTLTPEQAAQLQQLQRRLLQVRPEDMAEVLQQWVEQDPSAALQWVQTLPGNTQAPNATPAPPVFSPPTGSAK